MFRRSTALAAALMLSVSAAPLSGALAFEPTGSDVADAFLTLLETEDGTVESYASATETGDGFVIENLRVVSEGNDNAVVTIARTVLEDGEVLSNGRLSLGAMSMDTLELTSNDGGMTIGSLAATEVVLPSPEEASNMTDLTVDGPVYKSVDVQTINVTAEDGNTVAIGRVAATVDEMVDDMPTAGSLAVEGITIDAASLSDGDAQEFRKLGYETVTLNVTAEGKWDPETAEVDLSTVSISGEEVGTLALSLSLGGITKELIEQLDAAQDSPEEAMALLQGVLVNGMTIDLTNDSLVDRVLDQQAEEAGMDRTAYVSQMTAALPLMLGMLQNPDFQQEVATAVTTFLTDPQSLNVAAAPGNPVPVAQIMGTVMMAPQALPQMLGVSITANQ